MKKLVVMMATIGLLAGCGDSGSPSQNPLNKSLGYQLAFLSAGKDIPDGDPSVAEADRLLEKASTIFGQPKEDIANIATKAQGMLEGEGVTDETPLSLLDATVSASDAGLQMKQGDYKNMAVLYAMAREKGASRAEAITSLREMFRNIATMKPENRGRD